MTNKKLKKIMTDLAAGHISKKEADAQVSGLKSKKVVPKIDQQKKKKILIREKKKVNAIGGK